MSVAEVESPCVNICQMDPATGYCLGCLRSIDEIAGWMDLSNERKRAIVAQLEERKKVLA
jgi:uncharacterized protein